MKKFPHLPAVALAVAILGLGFAQSWRTHALETKNGILEAQLHEAFLHRLEAPVPAPVPVTCECPTYEEGWDDAEFAGGCDPHLSDLPVEDLRAVCFELDAYGYIPGC